MSRDQLFLIILYSITKNPTAVRNQIVDNRRNMIKELANEAQYFSESTM